MLNILDIDIKGKTLLVRIDINSPIHNGKVIKNLRMERHAKVIEELSNKGARIVLLAHQGRKDNADFTTLEHHAKILSELSKKFVGYSSMISEYKVIDEIKRMHNGDILLLENIRSLEEEITNPYGAQYVKKLSEVVDAFVLDTLSVSHREHASVVGFSKYLSVYAGPVLTKEINALEKIKYENDVVLIFGGSKTQDIHRLLHHWIPKTEVKHILLGGKLGFEMTRKELITLYGPDSKKIVLPIDGITQINEKIVESNVEEGNDNSGFKDIGNETIKLFKKHISLAKYALMNGPMGMYENIAFRNGTCEVLKCIATDKLYAIIGGGHTISAAQICDVDLDKFNYISLSGKALLKFIEGDRLPGLKTLGYYNKS